MASESKKTVEFASELFPLQNHGNLTKKVENGWNSVVSIVSNMRETLFAVVGKEIIYCLWFHYLYHREIELYTLCVEKERERATVRETAKNYLLWWWREQIIN